jgi:hypothetical protein
LLAALLFVVKLENQQSFSINRSKSNSGGFVMRSKAIWLCGFLLQGFACLSVFAEVTDASRTASHTQARVIRPELGDKELKLNTFAMSRDGELWLCCTGGAKETGGTILVYQTDGTFKRSIEVGFVPQAINFAPNGTPFVAGSGEVARLDKNGKADLSVAAPNILSEEEMKVKLEAASKQMLERSLESYKKNFDRVREQVELIEKQIVSDKEKAEPDEREIARSEKRLELLKKTLASQQQSFDRMKSTLSKSYSATSLIARMKKATGLTATSKDVFVSVPSLAGSGYDIYRMSHDLTAPEVVKEQVRGCCGQLDIQSIGNDLVVAENCNFKVAIYDRAGKSIRNFGDRNNDPKKPDCNLTGWGSCCNPMNVRCLNNGEILVAESSIGHMKRYSSEGEFLGIVGTAKIAGGCKHVAVARDDANDWYFMMNTTANNIAVLVPKSQAPDETEQARDARLAMQGLGQKLIGSWKFERRTDKNAAEADVGKNSKDVDESQFDQGKHLVDRVRFLRLDVGGKASRTESIIETAKPAAANSSKSSGGLFGVISGLFSSKKTSVVAAPVSIVKEDPLRWETIKQEQDVVQFALFESDQFAFSAAVRFIDDHKAEFKFYDEGVRGAPLAVATYTKVAGCNAGSCEAGVCDKTENGQAACDKDQVKAELK